MNAYEVGDSGCVVSQLLYFSAASDAYDGFLRALAVVMATHMPRIPLKKKPTSPTPGSAALIVLRYVYHCRNWVQSSVYVSGWPTDNGFYIYTYIHTCTYIKHT